MNSAAKLRHLARRQQRVRQRIFGTDERPRLNVFRSSGHIYAQIINDLKGTTLAAASSLDKSLRTSLKSTSSIAAGLKEQLIFPEIQYDEVGSIHGMDITIVTTARTNDEGKALLTQLGMPFRT